MLKIIFRKDGAHSAQPRFQLISMMRPLTANARLNSVISAMKAMNDGAIRK
jgi:hypothetical protein